MGPGREKIKHFKCMPIGRALQECCAFGRRSSVLVALIDEIPAIAVIDQRAGSRIIAERLWR
jgi:hypothetical protein